MHVRRLDIGFRGRRNQWNIDRHQVLREFSPSGSMATSKPEEGRIYEELYGN